MVVLLCEHTNKPLNHTLEMGDFYTRSVISQQSGPKKVVEKCFKNILHKTCHKWLLKIFIWKGGEVILNRGSTIILSLLNGHRVWVYSIILTVLMFITALSETPLGSKCAPSKLIHSRSQRLVQAGVLNTKRDSSLSIPHLCLGKQSPTRRRLEE